MYVHSNSFMQNERMLKKTRNMYQYNIFSMFFCMLSTYLYTSNWYPLIQLLLYIYTHKFIEIMTVFPYFQAVCPHDPVILPEYQP